MAEEGFKRKLTAILSADVKGYSRLMGEDEAETVKTLTTYRKIMGELIQQHRGRVVDSPGDNILAEFGSVVDAVQCAVAAQNEFKARNAELPENRRMEFRIGVNLGDVIEEESRIYGDGVNIAARLEALADPGGICVSKTAFDHIETKLPLGYEFMGEQEVKNIAKPVGVYRVLMEPRVTVAGVKQKKPPIPVWRRKGVLAGALAALIVIIGVAVWNFYWRAPKIEPASKEKMAFPLPEQPSIAVLPFVNMSEDPKQEFLCDGMTEDIITALSKVPRLFVIARNSTLVYKDKPVNVKQVSEELGVRYVLEGSLQRSGNRLRITVQLIDGLAGNHLWAERYDRDLKDLFALQDEITIKILTGVRVKLTGEKLIGRSERFFKGKEDLDCYLKLVEASGYGTRWNIHDNNIARRMIEEAIATCPENPSGYIALGWVYLRDYVLGNTKSPRKTLEKAIELAQKALAMDDSIAIGHALMCALYGMKREYDKAIVEGERAVALNPGGTPELVNYGNSLRFAGRPEEAIPFFQKAIRLNPFGPSYLYRQFGDALRDTGRFEEAVSAYKKGIQIAPDDIPAHICLALTYVSMGREKEARAEGAEVLRINPKFSVDYWAKTIPFRDQSQKDKLINALRKAGLPDKPQLLLPDKPSIAVLPFVNMSEDKGQEYFSDGLTEEIITSLSKTPKLFVIARNSSFVYKGKPVNVQQVSRELGVKYVLEGSVRRSGNQLRITAQLIDATTGNHLWAERYDRQLKDIFAMQDEIAMNILNALEIKLTEGEEAVFRLKGTTNLDAYLKYLQAREYAFTYKADDNIKARKIAEEVIDSDPSYHAGYSILAAVEVQDVWLGISKSPQQSLHRSIELAQKAISLEDTPSPHLIMAVSYVLLRKHDAAIEEAKKAVEIEPNSAGAQMIFGHVLFMADRAQEALPLLQRAIRLNPYPPSNYYHNLAFAYIILDQYEEAITAAKAAVRIEPNNLFAHSMLASSYSILGRAEEASKEVSEVLRINPNYSVDAAEKRMPLKNKEKAKRYYDSLRKAGLK